MRMSQVGPSSGRPPLAGLTMVVNVGVRLVRMDTVFSQA